MSYQLQPIITSSNVFKDSNHRFYFICERCFSTTGLRKHSPLQEDQTGQLSSGSVPESKGAGAPCNVLKCTNSADYWIYFKEKSYTYL